MKGISRVLLAMTAKVSAGMRMRVANPLNSGLMRCTDTLASMLYSGSFRLTAIRFTSALMMPS